MTGSKKIPMRMCVSCREMKPKAELMRIVLNKEGEIFFDNKGKQNGRGAYICKSADCIKKAQKTSALNRAFNTSIKDEIFEKLLSEAEK